MLYSLGSKNIIIIIIIFLLLKAYKDKFIKNRVTCYKPYIYSS